MDITFDISDKRFNYRVSALIIADNSILVMKDNNAGFFYLPGGRVELGETAEHAILRELNEELHIIGNIDRALWFTQSFFHEENTGKDYHEICLYYLINISHTHLCKASTGNSFTTVDEKGTLHHLEWVAFDKLKEKHVYPLFLKERIFDLPDSLEIMIESRL